MSQKKGANQVTVESSRQSDGSLRHHHTEPELHATDQESQSLSRDAIPKPKLWCGEQCSLRKQKGKIQRSATRRRQAKRLPQKFDER